MHRQTHDDLADFLGFYQLSKILSIALGITARIGVQGRGDSPVRIADGQADANAAEIDSQ
jgi:hypothetical protein